MLFVLLFLGITCLFFSLCAVGEQSSKYRFLNRHSEGLLGWGVAFATFTISIIVVWFFMFTVFLGEQREVEAFIESGIHTRYLTIVESSTESLVDLDPIGDNLNKWYFDAKFINNTIVKSNYYNSHFLLDTFCPDWDAPDVIKY